jgi:DedD protein
MGLFSRKDSSAPRKPPGRPRPSVSSEAQAAEFRTRARRRLAGAVALVLAAVVVLPMLLDSEPSPVSNKIAIKIPDRNSPFQPQLSTITSNNNSASGTVEISAAPALTDVSVKEPEAKLSGTTTDVNTNKTTSSTGNKSEVKSDTKSKVDTKTDTKTDTKPDAKGNTANTANAKASSGSETQTPAKNRSDDGALALALLEGRTNPAALPGPGATNAQVKAPTKGNFVVQAASLDTQLDAQGQRDKLIASGISNAFVDGPVEVAGRQKFRVKIGPFSSREAAQAAQTRLRTLGFGGAFIAQQ